MAEYTDVNSALHTIVAFRDQPFRWEELDAAAGDYMVCFAVSDLDCNAMQDFVNITVK